MSEVIPFSRREHSLLKDLVAVTGMSRNTLMNLVRADNCPWDKLMVKLPGHQPAIAFPRKQVAQTLRRALQINRRLAAGEGPAQAAMSPRDSSLLAMAEKTLVEIAQKRGTLVSRPAVLSQFVAAFTLIRDSLLDAADEIGKQDWMERQLRQIAGRAVDGLSATADAEGIDAALEEARKTLGDNTELKRINERALAAAKRNA